MESEQSADGERPAGGVAPGAPAPGSPLPLLVACVAAAQGGGVALVERAGQLPRLLAIDANGRVGDTAAGLEPALVAASGPSTPWSDSAVRGVLRAVHRALHRGRLAGSIGIGGATRHRLHRALLARIERSLGGAPRHERAALLPLAATARAALSAGTTAGVERVLAELLASSLPPAAWLRALAAFAEASARVAPDPDPDARTGAGEERVVALLAGVATSPSPSAPA